MYGFCFFLSVKAHHPAFLNSVSETGHVRRGCGSRHAAGYGFSLDPGSWRSQEATRRITRTQGRWCWDRQAVDAEGSRVHYTLLLSLVPSFPASVVHKPIANVCLIFLVFFLSFFFLVFFFMVEQKGQKTTHSCGRDMRWFDNVSKYVLGD